MAREIKGEEAGSESDTMAGGDHEKEKMLSKRARTQVPSSSSEVCCFSLIEEVLCRLPTLKSALLCKSVCKDWYSLISTSYFARRFITHHSNYRYGRNPSALIINYLSKHSGYRLFPVSDEPMLNSCEFLLSDLLQEKRRLVKTVAIYKDLILCEHIWSDKFQFCVCNPFTKQHVDLPVLEHDDVLFFIKIGFVCEPFYFEDSHGECTLNANYRFRVVCICEPDNEDNRFTLWTYCSETQKWGKSVLQGLEYELDTDVVAYNGKLLWYNGSSIFAYDPFNPGLSTFIDCSCIESTEFFSYISDCCLGVCQGLLRMMQLTGWGTPESLVIWELKDYATMEWSLVDKFDLDTITMIPGSLITDSGGQTSLAHEIKCGSKSLNPLGFHPTDKDIVYLHFKAFVFSCNTRMRELKMVDEIPCQGYFFRHGKVFHVELPLWPTPIPQLIESVPC